MRWNAVISPRFRIHLPRCPARRITHLGNLCIFAHGRLCCRSRFHSYFGLYLQPPRSRPCLCRVCFYLICHFSSVRQCPVILQGVIIHLLIACCCVAVPVPSSFISPLRPYMNSQEGPDQLLYPPLSIRTSTQRSALSPFPFALSLEILQ